MSTCPTEVKPPKRAMGITQLGGQFHKVSKEFGAVNLRRSGRMEGNGSTHMDQTCRGKRVGKRFDEMLLTRGAHRSNTSNYVIQVSIHTGRRVEFESFLSSPLHHSFLLQAHPKSIRQGISLDNGLTTKECLKLIGQNRKDTRRADVQRP
jgi:hypothetical protein